MKLLERLVDNPEMILNSFIPLRDCRVQDYDVIRKIKMSNIYTASLRMRPVAPATKKKLFSILEKIFIAIKKYR